MKIVQKGNKQLRIADERLDEMLLRGYTEVDQKTGKLIKKDPKDDLKALKKANAELVAANETLRAENKALSDQVSELIAGAKQ